MPSGELPHLETFCKAAELLNFTAAAEALHLTQAAVSQRIRALEIDVGVSLFDRHSGRVSLSPEGQVFYGYAQSILALGHQARAALGQPRPQLTGELAIGASTVPAEYLLPDLLQTFQRAYPQVHVRATVADSLDVLAALEDGRITLALVGRPGPSSWCESKSFARDHLVLVIPPGHRWAQRSRVSLKDLKEEPLILREPGSGARACFEEALKERGESVRDYRISLELGSNEAIKEALLRSAGVALLSAFAVKHDVESGKLKSLAVADVKLARDLYVVTDRRRVLAPTARAFLEVVESSAFVKA